MLASRAPIQSAARAQVFAPIRSLPRRDLNAAYDILRTILPARLAERWLTLHPPPDWTNPGLAAFEAQSPQLDHHPRRHRRLRQSRSHRRRHRHQRARRQNHAIQKSPRPLLHRRSSRRHRLARRIQLPMGLGLRRSRRPLPLDSFALEGGLLCPGERVLRLDRCRGGSRVGLGSALHVCGFFPQRREPLGLRT